MGDRTGIEWTDATWNPVTGCTKVSAGCDNCYAEVLARRRLRDIYLAQSPAVDTAENQADPFAVRLWPARLKQPARWATPRIVFVNSMSDLFHADIPERYVRDVFEVMLSTKRHIYQVLTKRPGRAARFCSRNKDLFENGIVPPFIWIGTSVEHRKTLHRVCHLKTIPAAVRFLSCEPLLGPLVLDLSHIHWVIVGGESGAGCRPMDPDWARHIRDQCLAARVPFFFKQFGGLRPKSGGRLLDGVEWSELPALDRKHKIPAAVVA
jgi:protein gp37